jgi:phage baseplate assembly protein W
VDNKVIKNRSKAFLGIGWAFPINFSEGDLQVDVSTYENNVNENIKILLQTPFGDRLLQPDLGSGLQQFFFEEISETLLGEIRQVVTSALLENEPRITVEEVEVDVVDMFEGKINITIFYVFNQTNTRHNYVYPFYINEGTNINRPT